MPSVSPKQKQLIAMDLKRAQSGQKTYTGMNLGQLAEWHTADKRKKGEGEK